MAASASRYGDVYAYVKCDHCEGANTALNPGADRSFKCKKLNNLTDEERTTLRSEMEEVLVRIGLAHGEGILSHDVLDRFLSSPRVEGFVGEVTSRHICVHVFIEHCPALWAATLRREICGSIDAGNLKKRDTLDRCRGVIHGAEADEAGVKRPQSTESFQVALVPSSTSCLNAGVLIREEAARILEEIGNVNQEKNSSGCVEEKENESSKGDWLLAAVVKKQKEVVKKRASHWPDLRSMC
ncbi:hypothetical protein FB451DRAFT_1180316 [Mycena latifolia]|nr:hypothetical protein FB451DRAFT_1180316 [Mycena latifolia]